MQFPEDFEDIGGKVEFQSVDEDGGPVGTKIKLPMPPGMTFADGAAYENAELGGFGAAFADDNIIKSAKSYVDTGDFLGQTGNLVKDVAARMGGNRVRAKLGRTPNPNTRALFKQVNLRTFQFNYKLIPSSESESKEITKIIRAFRKELYPMPTSQQEQNFQTGYLFPLRFEVFFFVRMGKSFITTDDMPKMQPAYLTAFQTSFNSSGPTMFTDGDGAQSRFSEVDMSITLMESRTLFKHDVEKGF